MRSRRDRFVQASTERGGVCVRDEERKTPRGDRPRRYGMGRHGLGVMGHTGNKRLYIIIRRGRIDK